MEWILGGALFVLVCVFVAFFGSPEEGDTGNHEAGDAVDHGVPSFEDYGGLF